MCSKSPKITQEIAKPAAPPVTAPQDTVKQTTVETEGQQKKRKAQGKQALKIRGTTGINM